MSWSISVAGHHNVGVASCYFGHPGKERQEAVFADGSPRENTMRAIDFIEACLAEHPDLEDEPEPEPVIIHPQ